MKILASFNTISKSDSLMAGGKGASLGEMKNAGFPVPDGFVVLSQVYDKFLDFNGFNEEIQNILEQVDTKHIHTIDTASKRIQDLIFSGEIPFKIAEIIQRAFEELAIGFVAVRSSATCEDSAGTAWAGQLDTYLYTSKENLLKNIKRCWASLFNTRAIFYRFEKKLQREKISVAVVIQKMVQSAKSGIAFTIHPVTHDRTRILIEAVLGLGEAIVSGAVTPDSYVVEKENMQLLDFEVGVQTIAMLPGKGGGYCFEDLQEKGYAKVLTDGELSILVKIVAAIEKHYGFPCDIEWAYDGTRFFIVQCRPVTTLSGIHSSGFSINPEHYTYMASRPQTVQRDEFLWFLLCGYKGLAPCLLTTPMGGRIRGLYFEKTFQEKLFEHLYEKINSHDKFMKHLQNYDNIKKLAIYQTQKHTDFSSMDRKQLLDAYAEFQTTITELSDYTWTPWVVENILDHELASILHQHCDPKEFDRVYDAVISPTELHEFQKMRMAVCDVVISDKDKLKAASELRNAYYWHSEYSFIEQLHDEDYFLNEIKKLTVEKAREETQMLMNEMKTYSLRFYEAIQKISRFGTHAELMGQIINKYVFLRTDRIDTLKRFQASFRPFYNTVANLLNQLHKDQWQAVDVIFLTQQEINDFLRDGAYPDISITRQRQNNYLYIRNENGIKIINSEEEVKQTMIRFSISTDRTIKGKIAYKGVVSGRAVLVSDYKDLSKVYENSILVSRTIMVDYTEAMHKAAAFVTDEGGITCHAAIVSRELMKPCIVGTSNATRIIKEGDMIEVDADSGYVRIISPAGN